MINLTNCIRIFLYANIDTLSDGFSFFLKINYGSNEIAAGNFSPCYAFLAPAQYFLNNSGSFLVQCSCSCHIHNL